MKHSVASVSGGESCSSEGKENNGRTLSEDFPDGLALEVFEETHLEAQSLEAAGQRLAIVVRAFAFQIWVVVEVFVVEDDGDSATFVLHEVAVVVLASLDDHLRRLLPVLTQLSQLHFIFIC